jgi:hypothetical protein
LALALALALELMWAPEWALEWVLVLALALVPELRLDSTSRPHNHSLLHSSSVDNIYCLSTPACRTAFRMSPEGTHMCIHC